MKTTLDIADDVLLAAEELGRREKKSPGLVISELARRALAETTHKVSLPAADYARAVETLPCLPRRNAGTVTMKLVNEFRDRAD